MLLSIGLAAAASIYLLLLPFWPRSVQICDCGRNPTACFLIPMATLLAGWLIYWRLSRRR